ncbi:serine hydrolase domain-containing protein [Zavarzinia sp. CC-PAN008]|uniref:serine hydrolase domain-containing protein n=1 Tax=Zavarzinia sp. CC-PAN008 TaxID=3243332 RepID=UPI003F746340
MPDRTEPGAAAGAPLLGGFADRRFAALHQAFADSLADGTELGASVAVTLEGEPLVDLWGGWADEARSRPWVEDTIVNVYSTTKTMMALTALLLADRGELDFDAPVARYWPEFAANGKDRVQVRHLMAHSAGLSGWTAPMTPADLYDWDKATALLAAQAPSWEPGTASGYHGMTQGYLVGEVVRRITGRTLGTVFREEIAGPLDADFHIGLGPEHDHRVADLVPPPPPVPVPGVVPSALLINMATNPMIDARATRTRDWRAAEIPAAGGHGNARSIARIHALLANGGVANGRRLLSEATVRRTLQQQTDGIDLCLGFHARYGLGFGLPGPWLQTPNPDSIFWCGWGGSLGLIDMNARTSFAYAMNRMSSGLLIDPRALGLAQAMWAGLAA